MFDVAVKKRFDGNLPANVFSRLRTEVEKALHSLLCGYTESVGFRAMGHPLLHAVAEFTEREGKRIRPMMLVAGFRAFSTADPAGLLHTACSLELMHSCILIHDDIIDKAEYRRGKPALHHAFSATLPKTVFFNGNDLALIAGDVLYGMAIRSFLTIDVDSAFKERALRLFTDAAVHTGIGQFNELLCAGKEIGEITLEEIVSIYDYKTAYYSFAAPLAAGAMLAGAGLETAKPLIECGLRLGRAFQCADDLLDIYGIFDDTGKPPFSDIGAHIKTYPVVLAYRYAAPADKELLKRMFSQSMPCPETLHVFKRILASTGVKNTVLDKIHIWLKEAEEMVREQVPAFRTLPLLKAIVEETIVKRIRITGLKDEED